MCSLFNKISAQLISCKSIGKILTSLFFGSFIQTEISTPDCTKSGIEISFRINFAKSGVEISIFFQSSRLSVKKKISKK
jgi:hypothetical protein